MSGLPQNNYFRSMVLLRYLLFPFAILYGLITQLRNFLYDVGILKSYTFKVPVIAVGNLSVGGTGKTPQVEYLIRLLSPQYKVATLSRGYKRQSEGFVLADAHATAAKLGDEPYQMHLKFPEIRVAVDADRKNGIEKLLALNMSPEVILLDDAFQHRRVKAGFYILLTAYGDLFCDDFILPTGSLREGNNGAKRAHAIIVTKCPVDLSVAEQQKIRQKMKVKAPIYFSSIQYDDKVYGVADSKKVDEVRKQPKLLLAGIAKPKLFFDYLKGPDDIQLTYPDHHHFTESDLKNIREKADRKLIVTTEKDFVRLRDAAIPNLYCLPIKSHFLGKGDDFDASIRNFIQKGK